ncbi:signal recognition particle-docking protein FtsY [Luteimonas sp. A649]
MVSFFRRWKPDADKAKHGKDDTTSLSAAAEAIEAARAMGAAAKSVDVAYVDVVGAVETVETVEAVDAVEAAEVLDAPAPAPETIVPPPMAAPLPATPVPLPPPAPPPPEVTQATSTTATTTQDKPPAPPGKSGWRDRLKGSGIARGLGGLFSRNPRLDDDLLDEIETALLIADVGISATTALVDSLRKRMKAREFADVPALRSALRADLVAMLEPVARPLSIDAAVKPFVILTVGVNGVGKTTTIGKLAKRYKDEGHALMLAAGDTFRAAAVAQLQAWGERNGVAVIAQGQDADAASVAFDALQAARARGTDVLIADTAGRLHTQQGLMAELAKIKRVLGKLDGSAPHEVLMVIDGTTGQNALSQLRHFHAAAAVTGLVVTKLDGTAKGGVVFALAREFGIPIRFAGIGERPEDLRVFDAEAFVDALLPEALGA